MTLLCKDQSTLDRAFAALEAAAIEGRRCPTGDQGMKSHITRVLAYAGKIAVEISTHNWRRITILVGPHAGKTTAPNPLPRSSVYLMIDASGTQKRWQLKNSPEKRRQPSKPTLLSSTGRDA